MRAGKRCTRCARWLPIGQYYERVGRPLGVQSACRACVTAAKRAAYRRDPQTVLSYERARRAARRVAQAAAVPEPLTEDADADETLHSMPAGQAHHLVRAELERE
jgi:hypothetical protein